MNREQLLEYLYGEMDQEQRRTFEEAMQRDEGLQKEVAEFQMVRNFLDASPDEGAAPIKLVVNPSPKIKRFSKWWSIAAAIMMLLVAGKVLGLNVRVADRQISIAYGTSHQLEDEGPEQGAEHYVELKQGIESLRAQLASLQLGTQKLNTPEAQIVSTNAATDQKQLMHFIDQTLERQQSGLETRLANRVLEEQQIYMQSVAQDLIRYWDEQRKNDLEVINDGLQNLAQSIQFTNDDLVQYVNNPRNNY